MKHVSDVPESEREHFTKCSVCEANFDMRDLGAVVEHEHWSVPVEVRFSHSVKKGKGGEVYMRGKRGMVTLRLKGKQLRCASRRRTK